MTYSIEFQPAARRELRKLPPQIQKQIMPHIDALAANPRPSGVVKLENKSELYRVRSGDYRIVYIIQDDALIVLVVKIAKRGDVYSRRR